MRNNRHAVFMILVLTMVFSLTWAAAAQADMVILGTTADSFVDSKLPGSNYGVNPTLFSQYDGSTDRRMTPYLKFDFSSIPPGSTIIEATLKLYLKEMKGKSSVQLEVIRATSDWNESTLMWQNKPTGPEETKTATISGSTGNKNFDVTALVTNWLAGAYPSYGLFLEYAGGGSYSIRFNSREVPKDQPYVVVYYTPPASPTIGSPGTMYLAEGKPPVISNVKATRNTDINYTITWMTDLESDSVVKYGPSAAYDIITGSSKRVTSHYVLLRNLQPGAEYHYRVTSKSAADLEGVSRDFVFKTPGAHPESLGKGVPWWGWLVIVGLVTIAFGAIVFAVIIIVEVQRHRHSTS